MLNVSVVQVQQCFMVYSLMLAGWLEIKTILLCNACLRFRVQNTPKSKINMFLLPAVLSIHLVLNTFECKLAEIAQAMFIIWIVFILSFFFKNSGSANFGLPYINFGLHLMVFPICWILGLFTLWAGIRVSESENGCAPELCWPSSISLSTS